VSAEMTRLEFVSTFLRGDAASRREWQPRDRMRVRVPYWIVRFHSTSFHGVGNGRFAKPAETTRLWSMALIDRKASQSKPGGIIALPHSSLFDG
jgi:hypothetical protein